MPHVSKLTLGMAPPCFSLGTSSHFRLELHIDLLEFADKHGTVTRCRRRTFFRRRAFRLQSRDPAPGGIARTFSFVERREVNFQGW